MGLSPPCVLPLPLCPIFPLLPFPLPWPVVPMEPPDFLGVGAGGQFWVMETEWLQVVAQKAENMLTVADGLETSCLRFLFRVSCSHSTSAPLTIDHHVAWRTTGGLKTAPSFACCPCTPDFHVLNGPWCTSAAPVFHCLFLCTARSTACALYTAACPLCHCAKNNVCIACNPCHCTVVVRHDSPCTTSQPCIHTSVSYETCLDEGSESFHFESGHSGPHGGSSPKPVLRRPIVYCGQNALCVRNRLWKRRAVPGFLPEILNSGKFHQATVDCMPPPPNPRNKPPHIIPSARLGVQNTKFHYCLTRTPSTPVVKGTAESQCPGGR